MFNNIFNKKKLMFVLFNLFNIEFIKLRGKTLIEVTLFNLVPLWLLTESEYWRLPGLLHPPEELLLYGLWGDKKMNYFAI